MKTGKLIVGSLAFLLMMALCKKTELRDLPPQLKLLVRDIDQNPVNGASADLYLKVEDFQENTNSIMSDTTDNEGIVIFTGLEELHYFFYVEKSGKSNLFGVAGTSSPLEYGVITVIEVKIE
jgi:hypothetical protein